MSRVWRETVAIAMGLLLYSFIAAPVPALNEPHYLTKANHYWQPERLAGDLFLDSTNAHTVFYATVGWLTTVCSLEATAICGRIIGYLFLAAGWVHWTTAWGQPAPRARLALILCLALQTIGNWSGEWVVGGIESKVFTFGAALWGIAAWIRHQPIAAGAWLGMGIAFHPVVGLWIAIAVCGTELWVRLPSRFPSGPWSPFATQRGLMGLVVMGLLALPGLWPVFDLLREEVTPTLRYQGTWLQVYFRLGHHLNPLQFPLRAHLGFAALLLIAAVAYGRRRLPMTESTRRLSGVVLWSVIFAAAGVAIAAAPKWSGEPLGFEWRMHLLKFYPFRLADVLVPLAVAWIVAASLERRLTSNQLPRLSGIVMIATLLGAGWNAREQQRFYPHDSDWYAVCEWIARETPPESLFLAPRNAQTFKWYADRAEYVSLKDCPQNLTGIVEWNRRLNAVEKWFSTHYKDGRYTAAELAVYSQETGVTHLLTDRLGPIELSPIYQNGTYRVYDLRSAPVSSRSTTPAAGR
jgi:hypothetical protein